MVVTKNDQKRRKKEEPPLSLAESAKRTKVHAQRKFAQGGVQGSATNSPALTPIKDKQKANGTVITPELIPAQRPKTHDFLTFLCLRRTPILPARLDFFSLSTSCQILEKVTSGSNNKSVSKATSKVSEKSLPNLTAAARRAEVARQEKESKNVISTTAKRRSTTVARPNTMQALKKKYQDQRLSKQNRTGVLKKLAQKVKDKNMGRTRSGAQFEPSRTKSPVLENKIESSKISSKTLIRTPGSKPRIATRSSGIPLSQVALTIRTKKKRIGLRSGGRLPAGSELGLDKIRREKAKKISLSYSSKNVKPVASSLSDFSSDDDQPLLKKSRTRASSVEILKRDTRKVAMRALQKAKARQRKVSLSPARMRTRSNRGPASPNTSNMQQSSPKHPPQARLSRKTKEAAAMYMELLGKKWMSPDDDDDEDYDVDSLSLYNLPDLRHQAAEKKSPEDKTKKTVTKKMDLSKDKKDSASAKKKASQEIFDGKKKDKIEDGSSVKTRQRSSSATSPPPQRSTSFTSPSSLRRRSVASPLPQRRSSLASGSLLRRSSVSRSPLLRRNSATSQQRRSRRGMSSASPAHSRSPPRKIGTTDNDFSDSDDEPLGKKLSAPSKKTESLKHGEKKIKKHDKLKNSPPTAIKRTRLHSEKLRLGKESRKGSFSKILDKRKTFLSARKSKEACIQELMASTLERLNKAEKEEIKRAQEMDLKLQAEKVELKTSIKNDMKNSCVDPVLLDHKLKNLSNAIAASSAEEKNTVKTPTSISKKLETKSQSTDVKDKVSNTGKASALIPPLTSHVKKTIPASQTMGITSKKSLPCTSSIRKPSQERSVSLPCSPKESRPLLTPPDSSPIPHVSSHCTACGRSETSQSKLETKIEELTLKKTGEIPNTAVRNLNWTDTSLLKGLTQTVKVNNSVGTAQKKVDVVGKNKPNCLHSKQNAPKAQTGEPFNLENVADVNKLVNGLTMLHPTEQRDLVVLAETRTGQGKYIVCRKDELVSLESTSHQQCNGYIGTPSSGPSTAAQLTRATSPAAQEKMLAHSKGTGTAGELKSLRKKSADAKHETLKEHKISSSDSNIRRSPEQAEKRAIFQRKREKLSLSRNTDAFSPHNESSVYAFDTEPEEVPAGIPFRRRAKDDSITPPITHSVSCSTESAPSKPMAVPSTSQSSSVSIPTYVSRNVSSSSIAVQVNLDDVASTSSESPNEAPVRSTSALSNDQPDNYDCFTHTDEDDDDGHLFYIPLQHGAPAPQQLIQGVAVKLGTDGPSGPNQRVIMRAKLVTKPPERFSKAINNGGLVRSMQHPASSLNPSNSANSKSPLVGTVQPTSRPTPPPVNALVSTKPQNSVSPTMNKSAEKTIKPINPILPSHNIEALPVAKQQNVPSNLMTVCPTPTTSVAPTLQKPSKPLPVKSSLEKSTINATGVQGHSNITARLQKPVATKSSNEKANVASSQLGAGKAQRAGTSKNSGDSSYSLISNSSSYIGKPLSKRLPFQRQSSSSTSLSGKAFRPFEPMPTPPCFPVPGVSASLMEAPTFHPTEKDFQDPLEYFERIRPTAEQFGLCRIVPPPSFKPECKVSDEMRFTAYNHYVHKMLDRWGPNSREMTAIKKFLKTQNVSYSHPPWIGGMEVDLPRLYQTVQHLGGLSEVIEKKRWQKVADAMKIPKSAQDRVTKLDDIYCKFLLAYDTLTPDERNDLFAAVEEEWAKKQRGTDSTDGEDSDSSDESEECITKGRNMPLNAFYRIARNTMSMWFRTTEPPAVEVETEYWRLARERNSHVCVHAGSIDSGVWGYGFPCNKNSPCAKHPWNLKVLTNNSGSLLRSMGPVMGVTVPTLHVGMLFSTCCWYRDPHGLPWIEYLHTGARKIWYGIPNSHSANFKQALNKIIPKFCREKSIWLPSDTAMVPPNLLVQHGVPVCHTVQEPGQFILVFPRAFTSSVCTGYLVSESVYFAQPRWLNKAEEVFQELKDSCEPTMFSLERLLFNIAQDTRSNVEVLRQIQPMIIRIAEREAEHRQILAGLGMKSSQRLPLPEAAPRRRRPRSTSEEDSDYECEVCRANLYVSLVTNSHEEGVYCLPHAIELLTKKKHHLKYCKLLYIHDQEELQDLIKQLNDRIEAKSQKKYQGKHSNNHSK